MASPPLSHPSLVIFFGNLDLSLVLLPCKIYVKSRTEKKIQMIFLPDCHLLEKIEEGSSLCDAGKPILWKGQQYKAIFIFRLLLLVIEKPQRV